MGFAVGEIVMNGGCEIAVASMGQLIRGQVDDKLERALAGTLFG
jgi:hypothetical protein